MSKEIQKSQIDTLRTMLEQAAPKLAEVAPKHLKVERLVRLLLAAGSRNPKILQCSPQSVLQFAMKCSETGLEPIGAGGAWPIPYENRKAGTVDLQFIPDYRGLINSAKRAGCIKDAYAEVVKANDDFDYELGLDPKLTHKPARGERGELESGYCVFVLPDDTRRFVVMDAQEIASIRARSRAAQSGPWVTDEAEMWKKTVVRRAMKPFTGAAPELDAAIEADNLAAGIVDITPRDPIPMPKAIEPADEIPMDFTHPPAQEKRRGRPAKASTEEPLPFSPDTPQKKLMQACADTDIPEARFLEFVKRDAPELWAETIAAMTNEQADGAVAAFPQIQGAIG